MGWARVLGWALQPHAVPGLPVPLQNGQRLKPAGRAGSALLGVAWQPQATFSCQTRPQSPLILLGISLVTFGINVGIRPPEYKCLICGDWEASRKSEAHRELSDFRRQEKWGRIQGKWAKEGLEMLVSGGPLGLFIDVPFSA